MITVDEKCAISEYRGELKLHVEADLNSLNYLRWSCHAVARKVLEPEISSYV